MSSEFRDHLTKELAARIAHEVGNPLTSIQGYTQLLQQRLISCSNRKTEVYYTQLILQEVKEIKNFIDSIIGRVSNH